MLAFISDWIVLVFALIFLLPAIYTNDRRRYDVSTFWMAISMSLMGLWFWPEISQQISTNGFIPTLIRFSGIYVVGGILTSFIYWVSYVIGVRNRFDEALNDVTNSAVGKELYDYVFDVEILGANARDSLSEAVRRFLALKSDTYVIMDDPEHITPYLSAPDHKRAKPYTVEELEGEFTSVVAKILPPKFINNRSYIIWASLSWPITLFWLLVSRFVRDIIIRVVSMFGGVFNGISRVLFGSI